MKNQLILLFGLFCICAMNALPKESLEDWMKIRKKMCDKQTKITEEQWNKVIECKNFSKRANEENPNHEKLKNAWNECVKQADDVEELKIANNDIQQRIVYLLCSEKVKVCMKDAWSSVKRDMDESKREERKAKFAESVKCAKNVLAIE